MSLYYCGFSNQRRKLKSVDLVDYSENKQSE